MAKNTQLFYNSYVQQLVIQTRRACIYPTVCLPTVRRSGSRRRCLILIPPTAFAFGFIVLYWCALKWLSRTLSAEIYAQERTHGSKNPAPTWKPILHSEQQERTPFCHRLAYSAPPPVTSRWLGRINEPKLTSGWDKKDGRRYLLSHQ